MSILCGLLLKSIILYFRSITDVLSEEVIDGMKNIIKLVKYKYRNGRFSYTSRISCL